MSVRTHPKLELDPASVPQSRMALSASDGGSGASPSHPRLGRQATMPPLTRQDTFLIAVTVASLGGLAVIQWAKGRA